MKIIFIFSCSGMFRNVPEDCGMGGDHMVDNVTGLRQLHTSGDWVGQDVVVDVCVYAPHLAMLYGRNC